MSDDLLISCGYDGQVVLWNTNTENQAVVKAFVQNKTLPDQKLD